MSENILIGKSRKTGKWEILVDPSESYDKILRRYQEFSRNLPVNDDFSHVRLGRIQNTSTPLTLLTTDEKAKRDASLSSAGTMASNAGKDAEARQKSIESKMAATAIAAHANVIDDKNAMINKIRKATGQPVFDKTDTEEREAALAEKLSKPAPKADAPVEREADKTHEELVAEKNNLIEQVKLQSEEIQNDKKNKQSKK